MPRVTPCRLLRLLLLPWVVLFGPWMFLPSPTIPLQQRVAYIQSTLTSGRSLILVVDYKPFRRHPDRAYGGECTECSSLLIHWRLVQEKNSILLRLNEHNDHWDAAKVNVTSVLEDANDWNAQQGQSNGEWMPYFSGPLKAPEIPAGNDDEEINLPWFALADKHLFHYDMHGFTASPLLRAIVPEPGVVEVWSFSVVLKAMNSLFDHVSDDGMMKGHRKPEAWETLYRTLEKNERSSGLLATLKLPESAKLRDIVVKELRGEFPSRTYPIRRAMLFPLGPIFSIGFFLFGLIGLLGDSIAPIFPYIVLGLVIYLLYRVWRYTSGSAARATKEKKHVWGPTGPMEVKSHSKWFDEEKELGVQRPQTVRLGRSWKR